VNLEALEDRCLLSTMLGVPAVRADDSGHGSAKHTAESRPVDGDKLGPLVKSWTPAVTGQELVERIHAFQQLRKGDKGDKGEDSGKTPSPSKPPHNSAPPPAVSQPESPSSSADSPSESATSVRKRQAEDRFPAATSTSATPAAETSPLLDAADSLRPFLMSGEGLSDPAGLSLLDAPSGQALVLFGGNPEGKAATGGGEPGTESSAVVTAVGTGPQAPLQAQAVPAGLDALAFVALADGFDGAEFAPQGADGLADLSLSGEYAEPGLLGRAFEHLTDWLNTDAVRSSLPWLTAVAVAALAGEVARRTLGPAGQRELALPCPSPAGVPPVEAD